MEPANIDLLDAYISGTLNPEQAQSFQSRLQTDEKFRQEYEIYQAMISAIRENRKSELKSYISKNARLRPIQFYKTPTFYAAAAASVVLCIVGFFVISKQLSRQAISSQNVNKPVEQYASNDKPEPGKNPSEHSKTMENNKSNGSSMESDNGMVAIREKDEIKRNSAIEDSPEKETGMASNVDEIKVEGDKMVTDSFLWIPRKIYIPKPKHLKLTADDSMSLVIAGDKRKLEIQFWISPINYSGYHLDKNILMIYGNYMPEQASFQELNGVIYMKYQNDYYIIAQNDSYAPLKKEINTKILEDLENK